LSRAPPARFSSLFSVINPLIMIDIISAVSVRYATVSWEI
jgi:hypothetical protein